MSELPAGLEPAAEVVPRDSASTVVLREGRRGREVLLGVRSRESRFMPGTWAFPGGAVEPRDRSAGPGEFVRCAVRELAEETGIVLDPADIREAGGRTTPAMFPVRFHTAFFVAELPAGAADPTPPSGENERLLFTPPADVLELWARGRCAVPPPVLPLLRALATRMDEPVDAIAEGLRDTNAQEQRAPRIEFAPDIWMLPVGTVTMPPATTTNVWMPGGRKFVVIDPGSGDPSEQQRLLEVIERRRGLGHVVEAVVLTHEHQDHVSGAAALCAQLDVPLRAHAETLAAAALAGVPRRERLADGDTLDLAGMTLRALHTPGHSPGHLAFEIVERGDLIAGDLISKISTILVEPETGNMSDYIDSLERMRAREFRTLYPGHGPPLPGKAFAGLLEHRRRREQAVLEQLSAHPAELAAIARGAYREMPHVPQRLIELQTLSHLVDLERRGLVRRTALERHWELV